MVPPSPRAALCTSPELLSCALLANAMLRVVGAWISLPAPLAG